jgi:hypothetical protein
MVEAFDAGEFREWVSHSVAAIRRIAEMGSVPNSSVPPRIQSEGTNAALRDPPLLERKPVVSWSGREADSLRTSYRAVVGTLRKVHGEERIMSSTVNAVRNAIRVATERFEREVEASFTKEELQAVCETLEVDITKAGRPSTSRIRQRVRVDVDIAESLQAADDSTSGRPISKR